MTEGMILLVLLVAMAVTFSILMTGIHIVRQDEIGFVYRGKKFVQQSGPRIVVSTPIIGKVHRMKAKSLHITVEPSNPRTEVILSIADPSKVPVTVKDLDFEIRNSISNAITKAPQFQESCRDSKDPSDIAENLKDMLDESLRDMGFVVKSLRFGNHVIETGGGMPAAVGIPNWDDVSRKFGY